MVYSSLSRLSRKPVLMQGGQCRLCDEAAAQVASVMTSLRGPGAPFTTVAECKALSAADMADFHEVTHADAGTDGDVLPPCCGCYTGRCRIRL